MPNLYCRNTALPNIVGRIDYISSEHRQERLLASYDGAADLLGGHYWEYLASECQAAYEQANKKTRTVIDKKTGEPKVIELKCCQGRELMFTLCNSLLKRMPAEEIAEIIAKTMEKEIGEPCAVSIHLKHFAAAEDNLHAHVVFGERHLLEEPVIKIAERNLFFDAEGKRHYKKSEILDDDGELLPGCSIIKKGEVYEQRLFGNADEKYAHRSWTKEVKTNVVLPLLNKELKGDIEIKEYDPSTGEIPYMHETKGLPEEQLADVRAFNALNKDFREKLHAGIIPLETALQIQAKVFASNTKTATLQAEMDAWRETEARKELEKELLEILNAELKLRRRREEKELLAAEKKKRAQEYFRRPDWMSSKYNRPYQVGMYDKFGRKRTIIELLVMLAITVIRGESERLLGGQDPPAPQQSRTIVATRDWKLQRMIDTIELARAEKVSNLGDLEERLQKAGTDLGRAKAELRRMSSSNENVAVLVQAIQDQEQLKEQCEKIYAMPDGLDKSIAEAQNDAILKKYSEAKRIVHQNGLEAPEARQDLLDRHFEFGLQLRAVEENIEELKQQYSRLSKLKYNMTVAQDRRYCYDVPWLPEADEKQEQRRSRSVGDGHGAL